MGLKMLVAATVALGLLVPSAARAADFAVTSTADVVDAAVGDGTCSTAPPGGGCTLRAAVQEADAAGGASTVTVPAGRYRLTIAPIPEAGSIADMDASNGDLDLTASIAVRGAGVGATVIDGGGVDRVFETGASVAAALSDLTVTGGDATAGNSQEIDLGGGVLNKSGITLDRVELVGNTADGGGGMFSIPGTMPVIRDSLIDGNKAYEGGGLRIDHGGTIVNTTITGNTLVGLPPGGIQQKPVGVVVPTIDEISGYGGGIDHRGGALLEITNSTIAGNHALKGGGGIGAGQGYAPLSEDVPLGSERLRNTIVAGNTSDAGPRDCRTNKVEIRSLGHNIDTDGSCFLTAAGDQPKTDPRLDPLAANGGPTRTLALRTGSPAIDAGDTTGCPKADQRGISRPQGPACDIGAFEAVPETRQPAKKPATKPAKKPTCRFTVSVPDRFRATAERYDVRLGKAVLARNVKGGRAAKIRRAAKPGTTVRLTLLIRLHGGRTKTTQTRVTCR